MSRLDDDDDWVAGDEALHSALASIPDVSVMVFDHDMRIRAIRVVGGTMTSRDITAQKRAEAELSEATGRMQAILDHSPMAIYLRESDVLARIGGDEFALILPDTDSAAGRIVAQKLIEAVREHGRVGEMPGAGVTASVGITELSEDTEPDTVKLLIEADVAMYEAKGAGKDGIALYLREGAVAAAL